MADSDIDPSSMKVPELKAALKDRGLSTTGVKATLVARLEKALKSGDDEEKEAEKEEEEEEVKVGSKRKAPSRAASSRAKKAIEEEEEEEEDDDEEEEDEDEKEEEEPPKKKSKVQAKVDPRCRLSGAEVVEDYDCMLNQTNIAQNNNKFYVIQLLKSGNSYHLYTRWGRVGENGQNSCKPAGGKDAGIAAFKKQFKSKSANDWDQRHKFKPKKGKYTLIEIDHGDEEDVEEIEAKLAKIEGAPRPKKDKVLPCSLPEPTQNLVRLIFDQDMFKQAMVNFNIDVKKMPLGKLSKTQIAKGFEVLEKIEDALSNGHGNLNDLTSRFYTLIPHNFGRNRPPIFRDLEEIQKKKDMLNVLADIEVAQSLEGKQKDEGPAEGQPHPYDQHYKLLGATLEPLSTDEEEYKVIHNYLKATESSYCRLEIEDVFRVRRNGEESRFAEHDEITNRKLLWHGTNVAVVVAILSSGLRIMPHSGGRVGKGIYFASENAKSAGYVGRAGNTGIMFLSEVALGKEHHIKQDDCTLRAPPAGYDSIVAKGHTEPDPKKDTILKIDGKDVIVPQGQPIKVPETQDSSFSHSEYLIYKESQNRIRYLLRLKWPY